MDMKEKALIVVVSFYLGHRAKRGLVSCYGRNDCRMKVVYGIDSGRSSNHLRICRR